MIVLLLWITLTWMFFPILALVAESASAGGVEGTARLRPWPAAEANSATECDGETCFWDRPARRGDRILPGRILFVSVGFYGHAMPLLSLAEEMAARGHNVTFGTHNCLRPMVDETPGVAFLSAGRMPMHEHQLRGKLKTLSQAGGFWGLLTLLNDVYLPMARPMYRALLAAISPGQAQAPAQTPPPPPPPPPPPRAPHAPPRHGPGKHHGESASRQPPENGAAERLDADPPSGGNSCCGTGGTGSDEKMACDGPADCGAPVVDGVAQDGMGGDRGSGFPAGEDAAAGANSSWVRPFDLVVLDMGSLGGLDFAQKMGIPYMFNSPSLLFDLSGKHVTATLPGWGTGMPRRMNLGDRLQNAISPRALSVFLTPAFISMNKARREQGLEPFRAQDDVFHGARILVNTAFGVEYPHSVAPLVEMTGPLLPPRIARALSPRPPCPPSGMPPGTRQHVGSATFGEATERSSVESPSSGRPEAEGGGVDAGDPLALPFLIRTWLGGTGDLVAPGTAAFEAVAKQAASARLRAEASAEREDTGTGVGATTSGGLSLPDDGGVIYVNLGRMPQLDKWQLMTVLQALSSPSEATCWSGGGADDRLGPFRVLWVLPREQREQLLSVLLPTAPPPSFRLKVLGGLPHLAILAHPAVKAVVSHCGMGAAQEALLFGKPLLCLPMLADQQDVARRVADAGAGLGLPGLPTGNISSGDIRDAVADLVSDPAFRGSAGVLSGVLRRSGGTLRAADVVEGTLQLGGSSHLHPPEFRGPWHKTLSTDAYTFLVAGVILLAVLGYALLAALCYGALVLLRAAARAALRSARWMLGLHRHLPRVGVWGGSAPRNGTSSSASGGDENTLAGPDKASAALVAAVAAGGGLWDEALMSLLGGPGPPDPFPEDSLPELDGPAIDRQPAPGAGGRTGSGGGRGGGGGGNGSSKSGSGGGGVGGHLRSLSGELVMWPTAPNDGRTFDFRGWSSGGGGYSNGNDATPHHMKRWD